MGLLGFSFGFGGKDVGMAAAMSSGNKAMGVMNKSLSSQNKIVKSSKATAFFSALAAIDLGNLAQKIGGIDSGVGQLTNSMESSFVQASKAAAPMLSQIGLTGKAFKKAKGQISSAAYGLNIDAGTLTKSWVAVHEAGKGTTETLKKMGLDFKTLGKLQEASGVDASDYVSVIENVTESWSFSSDQAAGFMDRMTKLSQEAGVGSVAFGKLKENMGAMDKVLAASSLHRTPEEIAGMQEQLIQLAGVMRATGSDSTEAMGASLKVMEQITAEAVDIEKLEVGNVDDYGKITKALFEVGGAMGMTGQNSVDFAKSMVNKKPLDFAEDLQNAFVEVSKSGSPTEVKRFTQAISDMGPEFKFMIGNLQESVPAFAKMRAAGEGAEGALKNLADQGHETGFTLDDRLSRMEDGFDSKLKRIIRGPIRNFVKNRQIAFKGMIENINDASKNPVWGGLVKKFVELRTLGVRALLTDLGPLGEEISIIGETAFKMAKEFGPALHVFKAMGGMLGGVLKAVAAPFVALGSAVLSVAGALIKVPFKIAGFAVRALGKGMELAGEAISGVAEVAGKASAVVFRMGAGLLRMGSGIPIIGGAFEGLSMILGSMGDLVESGVTTAFKGMGGMMKFVAKGAPHLAGAIEGVGDGFSNVSVGILKSLGTMSAFVLAGGAFGSAFEDDWKKVRPIVSEALRSIEEFLSGIDGEAVGKRIGAFFSGIPSQAAKTFGGAGDAASAEFSNAFSGAGGQLFKVIGGFFTGLGGVIWDALKGVNWGQIGTEINKAFGFGDFFERKGTEAWQALKDIPWASVADEIVGFLSPVFRKAIGVSFDGINDELHSRFPELFDRSVEVDMAKAEAPMNLIAAEKSAFSTENRGASPRDQEKMAQAFKDLQRIEGRTLEERLLGAMKGKEAQKAFEEKLGKSGVGLNSMVRFLTAMEESGALAKGAGIGNIKDAMEEMKTVERQAIMNALDLQSSDTIKLLSRDKGQKSWEETNMIAATSGTAQTTLNAPAYGRGEKIYNEVGPSKQDELDEMIDANFKLAGEMTAGNIETINNALEETRLHKQTIKDIALMTPEKAESILSSDDLGPDLGVVVANAQAKALDMIRSGDMDFEGAGNELVTQIGEGITDGSIDLMDTYLSMMDTVDSMNPHSEPEDASSPWANLGDVGVSYARNLGAGMHEGFGQLETLVRQDMAMVARGAIDAFTTEAAAASKDRMPELVGKLKRTTMQALGRLDSMPDVKQRVEMVAEATGIGHVVQAIIVESARQIEVLNKIEKHTSNLKANAKGSGIVVTGTGL